MPCLKELRLIHCAATDARADESGAQCVAARCYRHPLFLHHSELPAHDTETYYRATFHHETTLMLKRRRCRHRQITITGRCRRR